MSAPTAVVEAPAKLTLSLKMVGQRNDGYHLLDAEMVSISLCDRLIIKPLPDRSPSTLTVTGPYASGVPIDASNLVLRALDLCGRSAAITLEKQIPHGGGLGGGSTDAAAVLRWADYHDLVAASSVGADIAFCVVGGRARVSGIGEIVEPLPHIDRDLTLVIPPLSVSTPAAYRAFDELAVHQAPDVVNDLEVAAIAVEPRLAHWRQRIAELTGTSPILAGSGATWFVHGRHGNALAALGDEGAQIHEVNTVRSGAD